MRLRPGIGLPRHAATGFAPFEATKGYVPRWGIEPPEPGDQDLTVKDKLSRQQVDRIISRIIKVRETLKHQMAWAQAVQKEYADRHRIPAPEFRVGDMVMFDARNVATNRPSRKLDHRNLGRFKVIDVGKNGSAVKLELPPSFKIFPWFHPVLLHHADPPVLGQEEEEPGPLEVHEGEAEWEVEEVLNSRVFKGKKDPLTGKREYLQYMVKWRGWPDDRKWYDWDDLVGCPALIAAFHRTYRSKPGPHESFKKYTSETWDAWEKDVEDNIAARLALMVLKKEV